MCIIVSCPLNVKLKRDVLERCYQANTHGCGFAYVKNGRVEIQKGKMSFDEFWQKVEEVQQTLPTPILCHFRKQSVGEIDDFNCHPFRIDENHALVHNGTLYDFSSVNAKVCDTYLFNYNIVQPLFKDFPDFYKKKYGRYMIEEMIGSYNKIAIIDAEGSISIFNESQGEWDEGIWYSNKSYLPTKAERKKKKYSYYPSKQLRKAIGYVSLVDLLDEKQGIIIVKNEELSGRQISQLNHYYRKEWKQKCKLKHLVRKKIVEPFFEAKEKK